MQLRPSREKAPVAHPVPQRPSAPVVERRQTQSVLATVPTKGEMPNTHSWYGGRFTLAHGYSNGCSRQGLDTESCSHHPIRKLPRVKLLKSIQIRKSWSDRIGGLPLLLERMTQKKHGVQNLQLFKINLDVPILNFRMSFIPGSRPNLHTKVLASLRIWLTL